MDQEINCAGMMFVVLHDNVRPWQADLVRPTVRNVHLPIVWREGGTMQDIVQDIDILDAKLPCWDPHDGCCQPPRTTKHQQEHVDNHASTLPNEDCGVYIPHVHHLLRRDPGEHE